ncbi:DUF1801 domain-containing protein [Dyadobacter sp. CY345]|uniref:DUF1801 domain-containing protein n=1 Tax=Dyadobacter sp. CY345 TaxID=2909335 RepID=UPI001F333DB3|nr:DUF1801 domain-containing protein [Dyadobacter sp. CY345]MCF2446552.1 DUF1801 domain-containing protein [Dyadobacter sp. CY345]
MNPEVTQYIEKLQPWQVNVCHALREIIFECIPESEERLQYGKPHYLKNGHYACVIQGSKDKVSFVIFNAAELEDIKGFFQSTTSPDRKTATIKEGQDVDYSLLSQLLKRASYSLQ